MPISDPCSAAERGEQEQAFERLGALSSLGLELKQALGTVEAWISSYIFSLKALSLIAVA